MIELDNVSIGYGKNTVMDGISLGLEKGKLISIIGVNGCGKSTLLKSIVGILPIQKGTIKIDGREMSAMTKKETAVNVSYLSQGKNIPDMTVEQMVLHGRFPYLTYPKRYTKNDKEIAQRALETLGIADLATMPMYVLSGGVRQTVCIAMALAQDTDYIFLDEPTTYLDIAHQIDIMNLLRMLADSGKCIVTVMHDLPMAFDYSDYIVVLDKKRMAVKEHPLSLCNTSVIQDVFKVKLGYFPDSGKYYYV